MNKIMRNAAAGVVGLASLVGCAREEPVKSDYDSDKVVAYVCSLNVRNGLVQLYDFDGDNNVDAIKGLGDGPFFYIQEGFEDEARKTGGYIPSSGPRAMTPRIREEASKIFQATQNVNYEIDKERFEFLQKKEDSN